MESHLSKYPLFEAMYEDMLQDEKETGLHTPNNLRMFLSDSGNRRFTNDILLLVKYTHPAELHIALSNYCIEMVVKGWISETYKQRASDEWGNVAFKSVKVENPEKIAHEIVFQTYDYYMSKTKALLESKH